jgi:diguanylate cyclase (GGDEF)-like protein
VSTKPSQIDPIADSEESRRVETRPDGRSSRASAPSLLATAPSWEALRGYATLMRGVLDALPFGVAVLDRGGTLTTWNEELASMLPSPPSRGGTHDLSVLVNQVHRIVADPQDFDARLRAALAPPESDDEGERPSGEFEVALHGEDGGALAVSVNAFGENDESIVICFRDATGELRARRALEHRAMHDPLTKLPNRDLLMDRLSVALARLGRQGTAVGVLFIDLDGFKEVNDVHGHDVGDELLIAVAERLRREVRDGDTVARFGGDEFVVLCEDLVRIEAAEPLARRLAEAVAQPVSTTGERLLVVRASIGVVVEQNPATSAEALVKRADAEMYRVKHGSR